MKAKDIIENIAVTVDVRQSDHKTLQTTASLLRLHDILKDMK